MNDRENGCKCHRCGNLYRVDVTVPNMLWELIKPRGAAAGAGLLCGPCIMTEIEGLNGFAHLRLSEAEFGSLRLGDWDPAKPADQP